MHSSLPLAGDLTLSPDESHHLVRVRRATADEEIEILDGGGHRVVARLVEANAKAARLAVLHHESEVRPPFSTVLFQSIPKGKTMDGIVQRATELGVDRIVPILSDHCEVQLDSRRAAQKAEKWITVAEESVKQCGNPWLPRIEPPTDLAGALEQWGTMDLGLTASLRPPVSTVRQALESAVRSPTPIAVGLAIGPEGDFSPREYDLLEAVGWKSVTLGPRVLRSETASCVLLALTLETLRDMLET